MPSSAQLRDIATTSLEFPTGWGCWSTKLVNDMGWEYEMGQANYLFSWELATHQLGLPNQSAVTGTENLTKLQLRTYKHRPAIEDFPGGVVVVGWGWGKAKAQLRLGLQAAQLSFAIFSNLKIKEYECNP